MKLLAVDGNSIANRAFYGIRPLFAPDGRQTNLVYGFISMVDKMRKDLNPDAIIVAFDVHAPTFRHLEYSDYKAGRTPAPDEFREQMKLLKGILGDFEAPVFGIEGYEADDILGTFAAKCKADGWECCLYTGDKDSFQLIDDNVTVYLPKTMPGGTQTFIYDKAKLAAEYNGLTPKQMIDLKALQGDKSDNIPGVAGIGPKTALDLVSKFGSIDNIYQLIHSYSDNVVTVSKEMGITKSVAEKLIAGESDAKQSYHLGTIVTNVPLQCELKDLSLPEPPEFLVYDDMQILGFNKFIKEWGLEPEEIDLE